MLSTVVILIYAGLFFYYAHTNGHTQWMLATIGLGMGSMWLLASVLPGFVYHHAILFLYLLPLWISLGSLFFFVNHWRYHAATRVFYAEPPCSPYLMYLALTGMTLHLAWLVPMASALYQHPDGLSPYVLMGLLQLYFLQPVYWILIQWLIMGMFAWVARMRATPVHYLTISQIQISFLVGLMAVSVYIVDDLLRYLR